MPNVIPIPVANVIAVVIKKALMSGSWYMAQVRVGTSINAASIIRSHPNTRSNMGRFMKTLFVLGICICSLIAVYRII